MSTSNVNFHISIDVRQHRYIEYIRLIWHRNTLLINLDNLFGNQSQQANIQIVYVKNDGAL